MIEVTCPCCGSVERDATAGDVEHPPLADIGLFHCNACRARVVFGEIQMRVVVEPILDSKGRLWILKRYQDPKTKSDVLVVKQDPQFVFEEAQTALALIVSQVNR